MLVAPSFESYEFIGEPFDKGGKQYIRARNPKTGNERDIRVYTEHEYAKAYPQKSPKDKGAYGGLKHARGFDNGYVTIIKNNRSDDEQWLCQSCARYAVGMGWYIVSTDTIPEDAPKHFKYIRMTWEEFCDGDDCHMKSPEEISKIISKKVKAKEWVNIT